LQDRDAQSAKRGGHDQRQLQRGIINICASAMKG
jgi:hypothetical protein